VFYLLAEILVARGDYPAAVAQMREYLKFADGAEAAKTRERIAQLEQSASKAVPESNATFRVQTDLTLVRFQVTPAKGQFLTDLRPEEFEILEDGVSRKIALFEGGRFYPRKVPLEITVLFDCSGSMDAADILNTKVFEKNLLEEYENVSVAIYGFSEELVRLTQPTRDGRLLAKAMTAALGVRRGSTPLVTWRRPCGKQQRRRETPPGCWWSFPTGSPPHRAMNSGLWRLHASRNNWGLRFTQC